MPTIRKLPEDIIRGIAAGEVIERPAAALKEILENALDAGATRIEVEWDQAGRRRLRVTDDGCGMSPEEARLALERHATSKIASLADLERVATFGFRGEALPSMAAVSRFSLLTRRNGTPLPDPPASAPLAPQVPGALRPAPQGGRETVHGWLIRVEGGRITEDGPAGAPAGTTVTVEDLFFSVPARLKFLKSDATERGLLLRTLEDVALAAPHAAFRVSAEGKEIWNLPAVTDGPGMLERLRVLWGAEKADTLKSFTAQGAFASAHGWASDVNAAQPTTRFQRLFINRRAVISRRLIHAVYDAYRGRLPVGRHPAAVIFLEVDPTIVDVNVHPAKREVRLSNEEELCGFLRRALAGALSEAVSPQAFAFSAAPVYSVDTPTPMTPAGVRELPTHFGRFSPYPGWGLPETRPEAPQPLSRETFRAARFEPVAQLYATYLLARLDGQFFLFDQHAAAERALYEKLTASEGPARQGLLMPWVWEPAAELGEFVTERRAHLEGLGFTLEPFGRQSLRVTAVPSALAETTDFRDFLEGLAEDLRQGRVAAGPEALAARAACRGSIMAGTALAAAEMARVITNLQATESPWTCPHGRPTFLRLSDEELAKRFRRG